MRRHSKRRSPGQSIVEMALILPFLLLVIFGIIDLGYYIYGYSTIYFAARNGTEVAAELPPYINKVSDANDKCVQAIRNATQKNATILPNFTSGNVNISYPTNNRALGQPIQVQIQYNVQPLTPLFRLIRFGANGVMPVNISARRSIEAMGNGVVTTQNPSAMVCLP